MTTSTALTVLTPEEQAYLDSLGYGQEAQESSGPNRLEVNKKSKDEDGNKQVIGAWHIKGTNKYFDGPVTFRPVRYMNKLIRYEEDVNGGWQFKGQTVYFNDFRDEIPDSLGGLALGRKFGKQYSDDEKKESKKLAGTYADIFGFVTFGDSEPEPVVYRISGGKIMTILNAFNSVPKDKRYSQYNYTLETYQEETINPTTKKKEYKDYWSVKITPDMSTVLPLAPVLEFDADVLEYIRQTNAQVMESHRKARGKVAESSGGDLARVINAEVIAPAGHMKAEDIFNDSLPF